MKLTMRRLPEEHKYYLCLKWGCVQRYREREGYFTTANLPNLFRFGKLKTLKIFQLTPTKNGASVLAILESSSAGSSVQCDGLPFYFCALYAVLTQSGRLS